ncbi:hypothetical protein ACLB2K_015786 [Fragaria x ananassa]
MFSHIRCLILYTDYAPSPSLHKIVGHDPPQKEETHLTKFPSSLEWIANNQPDDGSWGYKDVFSAHDRLISTLACVVALKSWNLHAEKCFKGMKFFKENLNKLADENSDHMTIGFELTFPSLLEIARSLNLEVPDDTPVLREIYARRSQKLSKTNNEYCMNFGVGYRRTYCTSGHSNAVYPGRNGGSRLGKASETPVRRRVVSVLSGVYCLRIAADEGSKLHVISFETSPQVQRRRYRFSI